MRYSLLAVAVLLVLTACGGEDWTQNPDQKAYSSTFASSDSTDSQVQVLKSAPSRPVTGWNAWVTNVEDDGDVTIITAFFGDMTYRLFLFEDDAREKAQTLKRESHLVFSGDLGPERSLTLTGARTNPEFEFYPTSVVSGAVSIIQDPATIARREGRDKGILEEEQQQRDSEAADSSIEDQLVELCQNAVREHLTYPASGSFSWFKRQVTKESDTKWVYRDVVTFRNALGADLPSRFICTVTIKGNEMSASVRILDGP